MRCTRLAIPWLLAASLAAAGCPSSESAGDPRAACLECAVFGDPAESPYVLPFPVGAAFSVFQTYCGPFSHGRDGQMSIDFAMPVGSKVLAARAGTVRRVVVENEDRGRGINYLYIEHEDGTSAFYAHLGQHGALVEVGDVVVAGQEIALSGSSGTSIPHLHFGVSSTWPPRKPDDVPVNFRNAKGALDERGGLQAGVSYEALPF